MILGSARTAIPDQPAYHSRLMWTRALADTQLEEQAAFMARQAERDKIAESKTAKNRAKRQKRKHAQRGGGGEISKASEAAQGGAGHDPANKSKFAAGQPPAETKEEANTVAEVQAAQTAAAEDEGGATRTAEVTITVVDDE